MAELAELLGDSDVGALAEGLGPEDAGLDSANVSSLDEVNAISKDITEVTPEELENLKTPDAKFEEAKAKGDFKKATENAKISEEELKDIDADPEEAQAVEKKLDAKLKSSSRLQTFIKSPVGAAAIEAVGAYFKFDFIVKAVAQTFKFVAEMVEEVEDHGKLPQAQTPQEKLTGSTLSKYLKFLVSMSNVAGGLHDTFRNAATFSMGDDDVPHSGAAIADNMSVHEFKAVSKATTDAMNSTVALMGNISKALNRLGWKKGINGSSFYGAVEQDPGELSESFKALSPSIIDQFKTQVTTFSKVTAGVIKDFTSSKQDMRTLEMYFHVPRGWNKAAKVLENFVGNAEKANK